MPPSSSFIDRYLVVFRLAVWALLIGLSSLVWVGVYLAIRWAVA